MNRLPVFLLRHHWIALLTAGSIAIIVWQALAPAAYGAQLGVRTLQISSSIANATTTYKLGFDISTPGNLGSISVQFCSNSPIFPDPCTVPSGFSLTNASLTNQSGQVGFTKSPSSTGNTLRLSRPATPAVVGPVTYTLSNVQNPAAIGTYYVRIQTYASTDETGPASDYGAIAYAINYDLTISAEVPPYLIFCTALKIPSLDCNSATGDYINFGELSSVKPSFGTSQILSSTNAKAGYNVTLDGTTLTSGNNAITSLITPDVSRPGTAQFGLNLRANASPSGGDEPNGPGTGAPTPAYGVSNFYQFVPGDIVIAAPKPDEMRRYTASYVVNVPKSQAPGVYVSTVTYICLGNF